MKKNNIKAILFDSGNVLNYPKTGNWIIPPIFYDIIHENVLTSIKNEQLEDAFSKGFEYLGGNHLIKTETEEFELFTEFHNIIFNDHLKLNLSKADIDEITKDTVYNDEKYIFYDDVHKVIPELSKDYKIGLVSDTWPSQERVYINAGLRKYFSTFVMSALLGVRKPDELMFKTALAELDIRPEEAIFIDDSINNVKGAQKLGINTLLMVREEKKNDELNVKYINSLSEIYKFL